MPKKILTVEEHKQQHVKLRESLDELVADFLIHARRLPSSSTVMELMQWAAGQCVDPAPEEEKVKWADIPKVNINLESEKIKGLPQ